MVTDNYRATFKAISACIEQGYEQVIMFSATPHVLTSRQGKIYGLFGCTETEECSLSHTHHRHATPTEDILAAVQQCDLSPRTLIFCPQLLAAPNVFTAIKPLHTMIPHHLGILGFDNDDWADLTIPTVSTIVQPAFQEGAAAAALLIDHIRGHCATPSKTTLSCEIIWRGST